MKKIGFGVWAAVVALLLICIIVACVAMFTGNRSWVDTKYTFDKAVIYISGKPEEIELKSWHDAEDGEQITLVDKNGKVYLVSANYTMLTKG